MPFTLVSKTAVVTGAGRGIGRAIAEKLAEYGAAVMINDLDPGPASETEAAIKQAGGQAASLCGDVTDPAFPERMVAATLERFGGIDVLVNNAAILKEGFNPEDASVLDLPEQLALDTYRTNTLGPLLLMQVVIPGMQKRGYGRIVNMSSGAGQLAHMGSGFPAYRMSKAALNALTRLTAAELGPRPIKVNAMTPGWVRTEMGGPHATLSPQEAADTAIWLATLPDDGPTGGFFQDRKAIAW